MAPHILIAKPWDNAKVQVLREVLTFGTEANIDREGQAIYKKLLTESGR